MHRLIKEIIIGLAFVSMIEIILAFITSTFPVLWIANLLLIFWIVSLSRRGHFKELSETSVDEEKRLTRLLLPPFIIVFISVTLGLVLWAIS